MTQVLRETYFEALILEDFLDGHQLTSFTELGLVDDTKAAIAYHLGICVGHFLSSVRPLAGGSHHCGNFAPIFT